MNDVSGCQSVSWENTEHMVNSLRARVRRDGACGSQEYEVVNKGLLARIIIFLGLGPLFPSPNLISGYLRQTSLSTRLLRVYSFRERSMHMTWLLPIFCTST
ncbi:hypothetical protein RRG08_013082 [Elysia crispata]|uniref:Uncharacterized protein n=1 Tax=Elysia crispata TaxID=231223 RepID=A0AAE1DQ64_9GAST|nr:hypothetical protein RRG08_013082 [Elysia crispata]